MANESFPYLTSLHVNDCYAYQDFDIPIGTGVDKPFRHLILTGKNGSGKTTVLVALEEWVKAMRNFALQEDLLIKQRNYSKLSDLTSESSRFMKSAKISPTLRVRGAKRPLSLFIGDFLFKYFSSKRKTELDKVTTVQSEAEFKKNLAKKGMSSLIKQFLVNKKVNQAFAIINNNGKADLTDKFFERLQDALQNAFDDKDMRLVFEPEQYEFFLLFSDGRKVTLDHLSDGFSALLNIILELLATVEMLQTEKENNTFDPPGIVLIDEPETHLHLEMQYQVMPLLTSLFPNIQFIVATHSPAVASSIKDATVFDLTTKEMAKDWVVGSSYSELMQTHFGVENEYSNETDELMDKIKSLIGSKKPPEEKADALQKLMRQNEQYISPAFRLDIESHILELEDELLQPA